MVLFLICGEGPDYSKLICYQERSNSLCTPCDFLSDIGENINAGLQIFPNPTNRIINISSELKIISVEVFDMQGKPIKTVYDNFTAISINDKGLFVLRIRMVDAILTRKVIVE